MTPIQAALAHEAVAIAEAVLEGAVLTDNETRAAVILFGAVIRYAEEEGVEVADTPALVRIVDALAYLTGTLPAVAAGGAR